MQHSSPIILVTKLTWCRRLCHWVNIQIKFLVVLITDFHYIRLIKDCSGVDAFPDPCLEYWSFCDIQLHQSNCSLICLYVAVICGSNAILVGGWVTSGRLSSCHSSLKSFLSHWVGCLLLYAPDKTLGETTVWEMWSIAYFSACHIIIVTHEFVPLYIWCASQSVVVCSNKLSTMVQLCYRLAQN